MNKFTFFWQSASPFSNWYPSTFSLDGYTYNCSEQYMMHKKALLFGDTEVAQLIMEQTNPRLQKALGREVRNFDPAIWTAKCEEIMVYGLVAKFLSTPLLKKTLLDTGDTILVEASPYDKVWGIGMLESDPCATDPTQWEGQNLLGKVLMEARRIVKEHG